MVNLIKSFLKKFTVDYSQRIFISKQFRQTGYDREIDEGMSSRLKRLATIDVSKLGDAEIGRFIEAIIGEISDYNVCKITQLLGFNVKGKRYLAISGEGHMMWIGTASRQVKDHLELPKNAKYVDFVRPLVEGKPHKTTDLGPYGSTGAPMFGVKKHKDAGGLRKRGVIG